VVELAVAVEVVEEAEIVLVVAVAVAVAGQEVDPAAQIVARIQPGPCQADRLGGNTGCNIGYNNSGNIRTHQDNCMIVLQLVQQTVQRSRLQHCDRRVFFQEDVVAAVVDRVVVAQVVASVVVAVVGVVVGVVVGPAVVGPDPAVVVENQKEIDCRQENLVTDPLHNLEGKTFHRVRVDSSLASSDPCSSSHEVVEMP